MGLLHGFKNVSCHTNHVYPGLPTADAVHFQPCAWLHRPLPTKQARPSQTASPGGVTQPPHLQRLKPQPSPTREVSGRQKAQIDSRPTWPGTAGLPPRRATTLSSWWPSDGRGRRGCTARRCCPPGTHLGGRRWHSIVTRTEAGRTALYTRRWRTMYLQPQVGPWWCGRVASHPGQCGQRFARGRGCCLASLAVMIPQAAGVHAGRAAPGQYT